MELINRKMCPKVGRTTLGMGVSSARMDFNQGAHGILMFLQNTV